MLIHDYQVRVRYAETDQMGYAYYGVYPQYYEIGRAEMMRSIGFTYRGMEEEHGIMMPVASMNIRYLRPAHYDDLLTIRTTLRKPPVDTITFHIEIFNEKKELLNSATVKLVFVDKHNNMKSVPCPTYLSDAIAQAAKQNV